MTKRFELKNGMRVLFAPSKGTDTVTVIVLVRVGSRHEYAKISGASHYIEHLLFKGTKRRPTAQHISRALDRIGAEFNAYTSKNVTAYYVKVDRTYVDLAVDILQDMLFHSKFDEEEMDRERGVIVEELNMYQDNPMAHVEDLLEQSMFKGNTLGREIVGNEKTIRNMPRDEVIAYYKKYYVPSNMSLVVSGNIAPGTKKTIETKFGNMKEGSVDPDDVEKFVIEKGSKEPRVSIQTKNTSQIQLALGFPSYGTRDDRNAALNLLAIILGGNMSSRLFVQVRERRGLAYFVRAMSSAYEEVGIFQIRSGLDKERLPLALKTIRKELASIKRSGVTTAELKDAKTFVRGQLSIKLEDTFARAHFYGKQMVFQSRVLQPKSVLEKMQNVTAAQIKAVAKEILDEKKMSIAVVGPYKTVGDFLKKAEY